MYKVFINDKTIFLSENINNPQNRKDLAVHNYINNSELNNVILTFASDTLYNSLYIICNDSEQVFNQLFVIFTKINAAGGIVKNNNNELLFIFRRGKWDLPKGKQEANESSEQAAIREVMEECGISNLEIIKQLNSTFHMYEVKKKWMIKQTDWYEMLYEGNKSPVPQTEEDITDIRWFNPVDINIITSNSYLSLKELIGSYIRS